MRNRRLGGAVPLALAVLVGQEALAQSRGPIEEVVVTAQKVSQSINDVGMSITAASGERLAELGVDDTADLVKIVPGFNFTPTLYGTPVYSIRGVGFIETTLSAGPTVSVYADEVPMPFTAMTRGTTLDIERVEILKGPQGTLYGQNSTGGAINYIAGKPTEQLEANVDASYGRFDERKIEAVVSGPLAQTLAGRIAVGYTKSDGWQESYTRSDTLGAEDLLNARAILEWDPNDRLRTRLTVSGWKDESESLAPQFFGIIPRSADSTDLLPEGYVNYPPAPRNARDVDWNPEHDYSRDNRMYAGTLRVEYDLTPDVTLTSLTSYQDFDRDQLLEGDGTSFENYFSIQQGFIKSWYQELRLSGSVAEQGNWIVGANYAEDNTFDTFHQFYADATSAFVLGVYGPDSAPETHQDITTWAVFGNVEYPVRDDLIVQAGLRYTDSQRDFKGCSRDIAGAPNPGWGGQSEAIQELLRSLSGLSGFTPVPDGGCGTMGPPPTYVPGMVYDSLQEDNVSWRVNVNWYPVPETLLYANVSQGYKAGSFPTLAIALSTQFEPVVQEELLAYETGFKSTLFDATLQLNGAVFYYDYEDKQILGNVLDPVFGPLPALVNVPKSRVYGFELAAQWAPVGGLRISPSVSYQNSKIKGDFEDFDFLGQVRNFGGESFPAAPELQADLDVSYTWNLPSGWAAFVGAHANYQDETYSFFGEDEILEIDSYTLVDLRAGLERDEWKVTLWGRNVTDEYYWTNVAFAADSMVRFTGMPATYGVSVNYRFR